MKIVWIVLSTFMVVSAQAANPVCARIFETSPQEKSVDLDSSIRSLSILRVKLDQARTNGTTSVAVSALENDYAVKEKALLEYVLSTNLMSKENLRDRIRQEIIRLNETANNNRDSEKLEEEIRRVKDKETLENLEKVDGTTAVSFRVQPGSYMAGSHPQFMEKVTLTVSFEMMATPTTQIIWKKIAELANQKLPNQFNINPDPSKFKGDTHPVESVSYDDVVVWLNALNELSKQGEPELYTLIPGHRPGDIYDLPTNAQWEGVIRGMGRYNDTYTFGPNDGPMNDYSWNANNSNRTTHPVALKLPVEFYGMRFYDMHGNVKEWVKDWAPQGLKDVRPETGVDPVGPQTGTKRLVRGGHWNSGWYDIVSSAWSGVVPSERADILGFRFIRVIPK